MLGGGPVVYWKTHHGFIQMVISTDNFYAFISFSVNVMYCKDGTNALQEKVNSVRPCVFDLTNKF